MGERWNCTRPVQAAGDRSLQPLPGLVDPVHLTGYGSAPTTCSKLVSVANVSHLLHHSRIVDPMPGRESRRGGNLWWGQLALLGSLGSFPVKRYSARFLLALHARHWFPLFPVSRLTSNTEAEGRGGLIRQDFRPCSLESPVMAGLRGEFTQAQATGLPRISCCKAWSTMFVAALRSSRSRSLLSAIRRLADCSAARTQSPH